MNIYIDDITFCEYIIRDSDCSVVFTLFFFFCFFFIFSQSIQHNLYIVSHKHTNTHLTCNSNAYTHIDLVFCCRFDCFSFYSVMLFPWLSFWMLLSGITFFAYIIKTLLFYQQRYFIVAISRSTLFMHGPLMTEIMR